MKARLRNWGLAGSVLFLVSTCGPSQAGRRGQVMRNRMREKIGARLRLPGSKQKQWQLFSLALETGHYTDSEKLHIKGVAELSGSRAHFEDMNGRIVRATGKPPVVRRDDGHGEPAPNGFSIWIEVEAATGLSKKRVKIVQALDLKVLPESTSSILR